MMRGPRGAVSLVGLFLTLYPGWVASAQSSLPASEPVAEAALTEDASVQWGERRGRLLPTSGVARSSVDEEPESESDDWAVFDPDEVLEFLAKAVAHIRVLRQNEPLDKIALYKIRVEIRNTFRSLAIPHAEVPKKLRRWRRLYARRMGTYSRRMIGALEKVRQFTDDIVFHRYCMEAYMDDDYYDVIYALSRQALEQNRPAILAASTVGLKSFQCIKKLFSLDEDDVERVLEWACSGGASEVVSHILSTTDRAELKDKVRFWSIRHGRLDIFDLLPMPVYDDSFIDLTIVAAQHGHFDLLQVMLLRFMCRNSSKEVVLVANFCRLFREAFPEAVSIGASQVVFYLLDYLNYYFPGAVPEEFGESISNGLVAAMAGRDSELFRQILAQLRTFHIDRFKLLEAALNVENPIFVQLLFDGDKGLEPLAGGLLEQILETAAHTKNMQPFRTFLSLESTLPCLQACQLGFGDNRLLHIASEQDHHALVTLLITEANITLTTTDLPVLLREWQRGNTQTVSLLTEATIELEDLILTAILQEQNELVEFLLSHHEHQLHPKNRPMINACHRGNDPFVRLLLRKANGGHESGLASSIACNIGLFWAARRQDHAIMGVLLECHNGSYIHGIDPTLGRLLGGTLCNHPSS